MAWTEITRAKYRRDGLRYASDTTDEGRVDDWRGGGRSRGQLFSGGFRLLPVPYWLGPWLRFQSPLVSRVEDWRASPAEILRPFHVSSPLHVARNVRISRIARPHLLRAEAYWTYPAGATFGPSRRTR
jgi:hypothetical protein